MIKVIRFHNTNNLFAVDFKSGSSKPSWTVLDEHYYLINRADLTFADQSTVIKLQEHLIDQRKQLDKEKDHRLTMDSKVKTMNKERAELQK